MRYMMIVKASADSEAGVMPTEQELREMGRFNEEMVKAGVMVAGEGLHPSSAGTRIRFSNSGSTVTDGPFTESKEFLGGFWVVKAPDLDAALDLASRGSKACKGKVEVRAFQPDSED